MIQELPARASVQPWTTVATASTQMADRPDASGLRLPKGYVGGGRPGRRRAAGRVIVWAYLRDCTKEAPFLARPAIGIPLTNVQRTDFASRD
jgi:hypothetical protein